MPTAEGKRSVAQEALHVAMAYEIGIAACDGSAGMRLVSPPAIARLRTVADASMPARKGMH